MNRPGCSSRIENLIRRFAGAFVLGSLALGWWVHPAWFLFTAFVGANLFQSSFTGVCPLESLLRRVLREPADALGKKFDSGVS